MRFVAALLVACVLIGLGALFTWHTQSYLRQWTQKALEEAKQRGELADTDISSAKRGDFGLELSKSELRRVQIADFLVSFWFVLVPLIFGVCLTVAAVVKRG